MMTYIKKNPIKLITLILVLASVGAYAIYVFFADPPGYCAAQQRYISDEEFIQIAVRENKGTMKIDGSEESIRTFYAKNPDCCHVDRKQTQYSSRFLYGPVHSVEVFFQYERNEKEIAQTGGINKYYDAWVTIDVCGKRLESWGISKNHYYHYPKTKKEQS